MSKIDFLRRHLGLALAAFAIALVAFACPYRPTEPDRPKVHEPISCPMFLKLQKGMTIAEVEAVLGLPPKNGSPPMETPWFVESLELEPDFPTKRPNLILGWYATWAFIEVEVDRESKRVVNARFRRWEW